MQHSPTDYPGNRVASAGILVLFDIGRQPKMDLHVNKIKKQ